MFPSKMKIVIMLIVWIVVIDCSMARGIIRDDNGLNLNSVNDSKNDTDVSSIGNGGPVEPRKHKPYKSLFLLMGGLQSLVAFFLIKIKIVLVTVAIVGAAALALKFFGVMKYAGYFSKNDYPPVAPYSEYHGYHGPSSHPSITYDEHGNDWSSYAEHYARSADNKFPNRGNMTEIIYSFMHVDKDDCRARLVCELEMMITNSPFLHYFTRHAVAEHQPPSSQNRSEDCATHYAKCVKSTTKSLDRRRNLVDQDNGR